MCVYSVRVHRYASTCCSGRSIQCSAWAKIYTVRSPDRHGKQTLPCHASTSPQSAMLRANGIMGVARRVHMHMHAACPARRPAALFLQKKQQQARRRRRRRRGRHHRSDLPSPSGRVRSIDLALHCTALHDLVQVRLCVVPSHARCRLQRAARTTHARSRAAELYVSTTQRSICDAPS